MIRRSFGRTIALAISALLYAPLGESVGCTTPATVTLGGSCGGCTLPGSVLGSEFCFPLCNDPASICICCPPKTGGGFEDGYFLCVNGIPQKKCCKGEAGTNSAGNLCCVTITDHDCLP